MSSNTQLNALKARIEATLRRQELALEATKAQLEAVNAMLAQPIGGVKK